MDNSINWDDLRLLLTVAKRGSFLQAAEELELAVSTVSRRLTKFEGSFGAPLLERHVDGCTLTDLGRRIADMAQELSADLDREYIANLAPNGELSGTIKLTSGDGFAPILMKAISAFTTEHKGVSVEYFVDHAYRKIARGDVDVAVRVANLGEPSLIYKKLVEIEFGLFATPAFASTLPDQLRPQDVECIGLLPPLSEEPHMKAARSAGFVKSRVRLSSMTAQLSAVRENLGAAILPRAVAEGLVDLSPELILPKMDVFVVTRPQALKQPHLRAFIDCLYAELGSFSNEQAAGL
ncbi:LysR family transcriptional regulator [Pseudovibrio japonicus]|uniref:LysR family transcriptional regulator n=1 Tax=Pseudovibrio japonicus TaxID=366534 RepID=UPI001671A6FE|nr:LysR family transcriptional regulator [Pseudovibrio japonicus]